MSGADAQVPAGDRVGNGADAFPLGAVDYVLGEGDGERRADFRAALETDLELAIEVAEMRHLIEGCRELEIEVELTGRVERDVRRLVLRRLRLFAPRGMGWREIGGVALRVAAVALISLTVGWAVFAVSGSSDRARYGMPGFDLPALELVFAAPGMPDALLGGSRVRSESFTPAARRELVALLATDAWPVTDPSFVAQAERFASLPIPDEFRGMLSAENRLARLRADTGLRFSSQERALARLASGVPNLDDRVRSLAAEVAELVPGALAARPRGGDISGRDLSGIAFAVRALVASGSSPDFGPHRDAVRACRARLLTALGDPGTSGRATVLAALTELAVLGDAEATERVAAAADLLARETLRGGGPDGARPTLLNWSTPVSELADAGRVLWIAPAFGTHAGLAFRARLMVAAHIAERLEAGSGAEQPHIIAAQLYGFGDLIDRGDADRMLALWRPQLLRPDFVAVHHLAWGKYPVRPGWAEFQRELRGLAATPTPSGLRDRAALLLSLCTNSAAPGAGESVALGTL